LVAEMLHWLAQVWLSTDEQQVKLVACPRNHLDRTKEQIMTGSAPAAPVLCVWAQPEPHHRGNRTLQLDLESAVRQRGEGHALDQPAHQLQRLAVIVALQRRRQLSYAGPIDRKTVCPLCG
jgi:hypothetical protein